MTSKIKYKIAGVVVLYHPDKYFNENINSYIDDIDVLFAIDNTEMPLPQVKEQLSNDKIIYITNNDNLGVAKALNDAAMLAIKHGYDFLLTMDQDSKATPGMIAHMLQSLTNNSLQAIGILSPHHLMNHLKESTAAPNMCKDVLTTMTSGNLLNLAAFKQTGPFTEKLFIDAVDFDYCLRLNIKGFRAVEVIDAKLIHRLGKVTKHSLFGRELYTSHHPAVRRYYMTRNYLYIIHTYKTQYPAFCKILLTTLLLTPVLIVLFEKNKVYKLKMIIRGYLDYRKGKYGKYSAPECVA
jgi:rhamnosyltransferase